MNRKEVLNQFLILLFVSFIATISLLHYLVDHNIMNYGNVIVGSTSIFGFYLDQEGWIFFLSVVFSIICSVLTTVLSSFIYCLFSVLSKIAHKIWIKISEEVEQ